MPRTTGSPRSMCGFAPLHWPNDQRQWTRVCPQHAANWRAAPRRLRRWKPAASPTFLRADWKARPSGSVSRRVGSSLMNSLIAEMRRQWSRLLENRGSPALLRYNAQKRYEDGGRTALQEALGGNKELIEAAIASIRGAVDRSDLPSADEIARLVRQETGEPLHVARPRGPLGKTTH